MRIRAAIIAVIVTIGASAGTGAPAIGAATTHPDFQAVAGSSMTAVACGSVTRCVAVGITSKVSVDGGITWRAAKRPITSAVVTDVRCPSATLCLATGASSSSSGNQTVAVWRSTDGGDSFDAVTVPTLTGESTSIACTSSRRCVSANSHKLVLVTTNGGTSWTREATPASFEDVTCAAGTSTCVATSNALYYSHDAGTTWHVAATGGSQFFDVPTCASAHVCLVSGLSAKYDKEVIRSTDGGASWTRVKTKFQIPNVNQIRCASAQRCIALGNAYLEPASPTAMVTTDGGLHWQPAHAPNVHAPTLPPHGVTCTTARCIAVNEGVVTTGLNRGPISTSDDLGATPWKTRVASAVGASFGIACPGSTTCYQVGDDQVSDYEIAPTMGLSVSSDEGRTWRHLANSFDGSEIACSSESHCLVASNVTVYNPDCAPEWVVSEISNGAKAARATGIDTCFGSEPAIACPQPNYCFVLGGDNGDAFEWTWHPGSFSQEFAAPFQPVEGPSSVTCPTANECFAIDPSLWISHDSGAHWTQGAAMPFLTSAIACETADVCVAVGTSGSSSEIARTTDAGSHWTIVAQPTGTALSSLACSRSGRCVAFSGSSIMSSFDGGQTWSPSSADVPTAGRDALCRPSFCLLVGDVTLRSS